MARSKPDTQAFEPARPLVTPETVDPVAHEYARLLRAVAETEGSQAGLVRATAAILAGVTMISDLQNDETVRSVLLHHLATAERRIAERDAGASREPLH